MRCAFSRPAFIPDAIPSLTMPAASPAEPRLSYADLLRKNRRFKNLHAGRRCFIIGNGPSTKQQDLTVLRDELTIAVNDFARNAHAPAVQSPYWVLADPLYWEQPEKYFLPVAQLALEAGLSPTLFAPTGAFPCFNGHRAGPLIDCQYYHFGQATIDTEIDFTREIPTYGQNVILVGLMLAFHLGCNPIYLVGVDHDILKVTKETYPAYCSAHSYPTPGTQAAPLSAHLPWEGWLGARARMVFQYDQLRAYAEKRGFDVLDATRGGHLEVFPKVEFGKLFVRPAAARGGPAPADAGPRAPRSTTR